MLDFFDMGFANSIEEHRKTSLLDELPEPNSEPNSEEVKAMTLCSFIGCNFKQDTKSPRGVHYRFWVYEVRLTDMSKMRSRAINDIVS